MPATNSLGKTVLIQTILYFWMALGAFLAAFAIDVFLIPNKLIDGGIVGVAMIFGNIFGKEYIPAYLILLNIPFIYFAYKSIGKTFLIHMLVANIFFVASLFIIGQFSWQFNGESLEVVVIGGALLGIGLGLIIRVGGCIDGTEILGIIINRRTGITVGQVVLVCNVFIFGALGFVVNDWHPPLLSLITYLVVHKVMDAVIVGLDETKSITIISRKSKAIAQALMHELGLGLTIMYGRGGFTGDEREIIYVIVERLQLADVKDIIFREDPTAFMAIENLHEVANGKQGAKGNQNVRLQSLISKIFGKK